MLSGKSIELLRLIVGMSDAVERLGEPTFTDYAFMLAKAQVDFLVEAVRDTAVLDRDLVKRINEACSSSGT